MSQENVEIVRRNLRAWQRDDFEGFLLRTHPEIEWHAVLERLVEGPESAYHGHEGMRRLWDTYRTEIDGFEVDAEEIRDVGDDRVVLLGRISWRGTASLTARIGVCRSRYTGIELRMPARSWAASSWAG